MLKNTEPGIANVCKLLKQNGYGTFTTKCLQNQSINNNPRYCPNNLETYQVLLNKTKQKILIMTFLFSAQLEISHIKSKINESPHIYLVKGGWWGTLQRTVASKYQPKRLLKIAMAAQSRRAAVHATQILLNRLDSKLKQPYSGQ